MTDADRIKELEAKLKLYETNGVAKLFYSLNIVFFFFFFLYFLKKKNFFFFFFFLKNFKK